MRPIKVLVPSEGVARAFQTTVEPLFAQMKAIQKQSRTLATLRDTLLPKLLSGELAVGAALQESILSKESMASMKAGMDTTEPMDRIEKTNKP